MHETIAPVTLFRNVPEAMGGIQIEVIGEAILKYGQRCRRHNERQLHPAGADQITPLGQPAAVLPLPGQWGAHPSIAIPGLPLINLVIGESPRAPNQAVANNDSATSPAAPVVDATNGDARMGRSRHPPGDADHSRSDQPFG